MEQEKYEIVKFVDNGFELEVNVSPAEDTVWLTQDQMAELFQKTKSTINEHIKNIYSEEELLESATIRKFRMVRFEGGRKIIRSIPHYNLDLIISVGFRVKSQRGIVFRKWATSVLKQYMLKGYSIDSSRVLVTHENYLNLVNVVNRITRRLKWQSSTASFSDSGQRIVSKGSRWWDLQLLLLFGRCRTGEHRIGKTVLIGRFPSPFGYRGLHLQSYISFPRESV